MAERRGHLGIAGLVSGAAALLLVLDLLLPWFDVNASLKGSQLGASVTHAGPGTITSVLLVLFALGAVALLALQASGSVRRPPVALIIPVLILTGLLVLLTLFRLLNPTGTNTFVVRQAGMYLGLLLALVSFIAAFVEMRREGLTTAEAKAQTKDAVQERGRTTPA
jgi:hypothetical protein